MVVAFHFYVKLESIQRNPYRCLCDSLLQHQICKQPLAYFHRLNISNSGEAATFAFVESKIWETGHSLRIALSTNDVTNFLVPAVTQTLNLISVRVWYGKVTFGNKFPSSLKMFIVRGDKIQLGFDNKYPENNQRVPRQR